MAERACTGCKNQTKYHCITCEKPICNREECCVPENNENSVGWIAQRSVAYCKQCGDEYTGESRSTNQSRKRIHGNEQGKSRNESLVKDDLLKTPNDVDISSDESDDLEFEKPKRKTARKSKGRKGNWKESHIDDMIDIIVNNEKYKKRLIFTNVKKQKNTEVYDSILNEIKERYAGRNPESTFPFNVQQMRTKFKWCVSTCKKLSMTIRTATGIKRIQDEKCFGKWFDLLYPLIKSRDSCQPEQALEPAVASESENTSGTGEALFVPVRGGNATRKDKTTELLVESMQSLKKVIESDPTKDILNLMREDMKRSREQDMQFQQLMLAALQQPGVFPQQSGGFNANQSVPSWPQNTYSTYGHETQAAHFEHNYNMTPNATVTHTAASSSLSCPPNAPQRFSSFNIEDNFHHDYSDKTFEKL